MLQERSIASLPCLSPPPTSGACFSCPLEITQFGLFMMLPLPSNTTEKVAVDDY